MSDHLKAFEAEIREDEREKLSKQLSRIYNTTAGLMNEIGYILSVAPKAPKKPAAARKTRKAVAATADEIQTVLEALTELQRQHVGRYFAIKELTGAVGLGAKTVGAALRSLEEGGILIEKTRKYCLAAVEQQGNGTDLNPDDPPF